MFGGIAIGGTKIAVGMLDEQGHFAVGIADSKNPHKADLKRE
jgi:hypothetical protein